MFLLGLLQGDQLTHPCYAARQCTVSCFTNLLLHFCIKRRAALLLSVRHHAAPAASVLLHSGQLFFIKQKALKNNWRKIIQGSFSHSICTFYSFICPVIWLKTISQDRTISDVILCVCVELSVHNLITWCKKSYACVPKTDLQECFCAYTLWS